MAGTYRIVRESSPGRTKLDDTTTDGIAEAAEVALHYAKKLDGSVTVYVDGEPFDFERWNNYLYSYMGCISPKKKLREQLREKVEQGAELIKSAA